MFLVKGEGQQRINSTNDSGEFPVTQSKIVILEANHNRRDYLRSVVSGRGCVPYIFEKETICLDNLHSLDPDLVISGPLTNERVFRFVHTVKMMKSSLPVLIISGDRAVRENATSNGFADVKVIKDDFKPSEINGAIYHLLQDRNIGTGNGDSNRPMIIGNSPSILKIKKLILDLKDSRETVLIQGEPGTGKELVARALHYHSFRSSKSFVKINLAALNASMLRELFFDSYQTNHTKLLPNLHPALSVSTVGSVFLDNIQSLPLAHQSRLLTIFEDGRFRSAQSNFCGFNSPKGRLIVTGDNLINQRVRRGEFRDDLFFRMNVISIVMPLLRDRLDDIPMLTDFFADQFCMEFGVGHIEVSKKIKDIFCRYHWPGNVRELQNLTRRVILNGDQDSFIVNFTRQRAIVKDLIGPFKDLDNHAGIRRLKRNLKNLDNLSLKSVCCGFVADTEKNIINKALEHTNWNRKKAAELLEISYKSLLNKIKQYQIAETTEL